MLEKTTEAEKPVAATAVQKARGRAGTGAWITPRLAIVVGLLAFIALVYWPSSIALDTEWRDTIDKTYTHGYLVLLISLWMMWRDRVMLDAAPLRPVPFALPALVVLSAAWLYFWQAAIQDPHLLLCPLLLYTALLALLGREAARVLRFPIGFLYFAMPVWSDLVVPLQRLSAEANGVMISLTGLPAYMDGDFIRLPAGTLRIAQGCSGMHFFIVGLALAALYGEVMRDPPRLRWIWLALMAVLALVANWVRIFVIAAMAYATNMQTYLVTVDHYWFGWLVFVACFAFFLWVSGYIAKTQPTAPFAAADAPANPAMPGAWRLIATLLALSVLPLGVYAARALHASAGGRLTIDWPAAPGWRGPQPSLPTRWVPKFLNATTSGRREYVDADGHSVDVYLVAYRRQRQGAKLVEWGNTLIGVNGLRVLASHDRATPQGPWRVRQIENPYGERSLLWSQYRIGRRRFAWPRGSQLWYGVAAFAGAPVSSALALRANCVPDCRAAAARLARAAADLQPTLRVGAARPGD